MSEINPFSEDFAWTTFLNTKYMTARGELDIYHYVETKKWRVFIEVLSPIVLNLYVNIDSVDAANDEIQRVFDQYKKAQDAFAEMLRGIK